MGKQETQSELAANLDKLLVECLRMADEAGFGMTAIHIATARDALAKEDLIKVQDTRLRREPGNENELAPRS
ncbi:hypothetical protein [Novosphingobium ginsenosidimutans]|uniref:Uncharacterized protein n=1 Tax=Novosphingobium ginsenosidimutans TaxID=1176536 RepID=A0A5B8S062_9SPHN|nr:hypothetical protein [Novosphingobium ginsenosidimutans]QEA14996.1 hypothetical protein FRF71_01960 [Novosphingobium ginsenosidimutans]